jgi:hypothetical protein
MYSFPVRLVSISVLLFSSLLLSGCEWIRDWQATRPCKPSFIVATPAVFGQEASNNVSSVSVYIDATPSVQGYLADNGYANLLLNGLRYAAPAQAEVSYFSVRKLGGQNRVDAIDPLQAVHHQTYGWGDTDLSAAADHAPSDGLSIIVTDLFQTDAEVAGFTTTIADSFLAKGGAVAVLQMFFDFRGTVYDVGFTQPLKFAHNGLRPLYLVLLGPHDAVGNYLGRLLAEFPHDHNVVMFGPQPTVLNLFTTASSADHSFVNARRENDLGANTLHVRTRSKRKPVSLRMALLDTPVGHYPPIQNGQIGVTFEIDSSCPSVDFSALDGINGLVTAHLFRDSNQAWIEVEIPRPGALPKHSSISFSAHVTEFSVPDWVRQYHLDPVDIAEWQRDASLFDAMKTQGLFDFVRKLAFDSPQYFPPIVARGNVILSR